MKNIYILPTDKPSRLYKHKFSETFRLLKNELQVSGQTISQNIYITSNEEIKEGDCVYHTQMFNNIGFTGIAKVGKQRVNQEFEMISLNGQHTYYSCKEPKVILTDNKDLIKDGVQAIPDDFLEWFVKNPNCEEVEVIKYEDNSSPMLIKDKTFHYKITIPKEEPKYPIGGYAPGYYMCNCSTCKKQFQGDKRAVQCEPCAIEMIKEEPKQELERGITITQVSKQETLEEATRKYLKNCKEAIHDNIMFIQGSNFGVKWQQERSYSKEEVKEQLNLILAMKNSLLDTFTDDNGFITDKWFEKFKKK